MTLSCSDYLQLHKNEIESLIYLQEQIMDLNSTNYQDLIAMIINSEYVQEKNKFIQLLNSIQVGIAIRPLSYELYFNVLFQLAHQIKNFFSEQELISIFPKRSSILKLFEKGLISINIISELCKIDTSYLVYFAPEMKEFNNELFETKIDEKTKESMNFDEMKKFRTKGENSFMIAEFIRNDDCDNFQVYLAKTNTKFDSSLPLSEYEQSRFLNQNMNLIDYAAFFGSIKIFKFLILNKCKLTNRTSQFAVAGGNYEIIHLLENQKNSFHSCLEISIQFHRNEIFEYLIENHSNQCKLTFNVFCSAVKMYNVEIFFSNIQKLLNSDFDSINDSILVLASIHGMLDIVHFICSIKEININENGYLAFYLFSVF